MEARQFGVCAVSVAQRGSRAINGGHVVRYVYSDCVRRGPLATGLGSVNRCALRVRIGVRQHGNNPLQAGIRTDRHFLADFSISRMHQIK